MNIPGLSGLFHRVIHKEMPTPPVSFSNVAGITITENSVSFLGVELERGHGTLVPPLERFKNNVLTPYDLRQMQKIAIAWEIGAAVLIESGSGLGKTETVERMCALLNWNCYYANCHDFEPEILIGSKTVREDTKSGFGWRDGIVLQAIRNGGVLFLDEYNFMRGETRGRLHEVLDAILRGKNEIVLIENDGERVPVHPDFKIVAAQNPPGGKFSDREILDPAQITRFVYLREPSEMPKELKLARALGTVGKKFNDELSAKDYMHSSIDFDRAKLMSHPDIQDIIQQFVEFECGMEELVKRGDIGEDQPQPVYFAFQRDLSRIVKFLEHFYDGDLYSSMKCALNYFYKNRFESQADRQKVQELINLIARRKLVEEERRLAA